MKIEPSSRSSYPMTRRTFITGGATALLAACAPASASGRGVPTGFDPGYATANEILEAIRRKKISAPRLKPHRQKRRSLLKRDNRGHENLSAK